MASPGAPGAGSETGSMSDTSHMADTSAMTSDSSATAAQAAATLGAFYDRREIQVARFNPADFTSKVNVSDADLQAFYKDHQAQFQQPEQASVEYLVLDLDAAKKGIAVSEADLRSYYDQRITLNDVSSYLGAKIKHIPALEHAAFQTAD